MCIWTDVVLCCLAGQRAHLFIRGAGDIPPLPPQEGFDEVMDIQVFNSGFKLSDAIVFTFH